MNANVNSLIESYRKGDESSFERLFLIYYPKIKRLAQLHGGFRTADLESSLCEAFIDSVRKFDTSREVSFDTFFYGRQRMEVLQFQRMLSTEYKHYGDVESIDTTHTFDDGSEVGNVQIEVIDHAVHEFELQDLIQNSQLTSDEKVICILFASGREWIEVADELAKMRGYKRRSAQTILSKMLKSLREKLGGDLFVHC